MFFKIYFKNQGNTTTLEADKQTAYMEGKMIVLTNLLFLL